MENLTFDEEKLKALYEKVVEEPQKTFSQKNLIKCPDCGEEILMIPTLRVMNEAIENHVHIHKEQLKADPIREHQKAISIRISLMGQVLRKACKLTSS
jgi:hypothetical protein